MRASIETNRISPQVTVVNHRQEEIVRLFEGESSPLRPPKLPAIKHAKHQNASRVTCDAGTWLQLTITSQVPYLAIIQNMNMGVT